MGKFFSFLVKTETNESITITIKIRYSTCFEILYNKMVRLFLVSLIGERN
ncbi:MAG: hypothetical protein K0R71_1529 [Bacillales bacterium]|jgi:hypothetical protein|nr:hypothetical protein [Bacillales bacterium]